MNKPSTPRAPRNGPGAGGGDPTRDLAFDLLVGVLERRRTLELGPEGAEEARDRAAAH
ncbi:rRNA cytosine-C5-methylase, partial [Endobacter medicaginis]|nr:rRNA cytosine-C5-methylase [Endobacter medicaginis]